jgi:hypothetical protein
MKRMDFLLAARSWAFIFVGTRKASLVVDGKLSGSRNVETDIPHGSPISPLLFLIVEIWLLNLISSIR